MSFFENFPLVDYKFGNEESFTVFRDITAYSDVIDQIKDNIAFYQDYYLQEHERPDQVSYKLYGSSGLHWTFFLLNDKLKENGWPISNGKVIEKAQKEYSQTTLTTRTPLYDKFKIGQTITGNISAASAKIDHRHLDLGQLVITNIVDGPFQDGEIITSANSNGFIESITLQSSSPEYLSAHHYENAAGETVDIDPEVGPGALLTEITYLDRLIRQNENLKSIRVIKPSSLQQISFAFKESISS